MSDNGHYQKPRLLDLFCGAGGAARGYQNTGFHVTGIDIQPQPRYAGDVFIQADALDYLREHGQEYDAIHASPPCQRYSRITSMQLRNNHPDLIRPVRELLVATRKPYVIENVPDARHLLINPIRLCGTSFGLHIRRHRYFETGGFEFGLFQVPACVHDERKIVYLTGSTGNHKSSFRRRDFTLEEKKTASGIDWMTSKELDEAIPPAYTEFIGRQLVKVVRHENQTD